MTISATFALQNVPINADTVRQALSSLLPNSAGGVVQAGDYAVTQTTTPSMAVNVGIGRAWLEGTDVSYLSGQGYGKQGKYFVLNDAPYPVTIATSDLTNPRIDVIYVAVQDSTYAGSNDQAVIQVATGVPAAGATYPANAQTLPNNSLALAWINVPANASSVLTANITYIAKRVGTPAQGRQDLMTGTTNSGAIGSTLIVINNIASFSFKGGRKYDIVYEFSFSPGAASQYPNVGIFSCSTADASTAITGLTCLQSRTFPGPAPALTDNQTIRAHFDPVSDTTLQIKVAGKLAGGTGTFIVIGNSGTLTAEPNQFYIEDKGSQY